MKKASIITYHFVPNYGAVLQVYALQKVLSRYIDQVEILDYRPSSITKTYEPINTYSIGSFVESLYSLPSYKVKLSKFKLFLKEYLNLSRNQFVSSDEIINLNSDFIFLGSDQIWNFDITNGYDSVYFAKVNKGGKSRVISYAASIGKGELSKKENEIFKKTLKDIDVISVRESEAANLLKGNTDKNIDVVLDPTLLLSKEEWECIPTNNYNERFVLLYTLADYKETREMAYKIAKYKGIKLIEIAGKRKSIKKHYRHKVLYNAGPLDYLSLIKNAEFVVTDSFHGTAFSVNFKKQFVTIPHKNRGGRITGLLQKLNLTDRLTNDFDEKLCNEEIDYAGVIPLLENEKEASITFIENSLRGVGNE